MNPLATHSFPLASLATFLLALSVILGAFGAHGLEGKLSEQAMATYQTGVTYHTTHALALLVIGLASLTRTRAVTFGVWALCLGILLFSGLCYAYALTGVRTFALFVPLGGLSFIFGWFCLGLGLWGQKKYLTP